MVLHLIFIIIYFLLAILFKSGPTLLNVAMITHAILAILSVFNKSTKFVSPKVVFCVSAILISIGNIVGQTNGLNEANINAYMKAEYIPQATLIWCVGAACMILGFDLAGMKSMPSVRLDVPKELPKKIFPAILIISTFSVQLNEMFAFLGSIAKLFQLFGLMAIMFYSRLWSEKNDQKFGSYTLLLAVIQTVVALKFSYLRSAIVIPTIVMAVGYFVGKKHIKYVFSYRLLPFIFFVGFFVSIFQDLGGSRADFSAVVTKKLTKSEDFGTITEMVDLYEEEEYSGSFIERSAVIAQLTNVVNLAEKNGFYNGLVSMPVLIALIPRFLWPEKPQIMLGQWFALETGTAYLTETGKANNSINMTVMGEMYIDFGWPGVFIGCILFGAMVAWMWNSVEFYSSPYNILGILFGGYILILSFGFGADIQIIITYISTFLILFTIKKVITVYLKPSI